MKISPRIDHLADEALVQDIKDHSDDYNYERAHYFNYSPTDINKALKRIGVNKKRSLNIQKPVL